MSTEYMPVLIMLVVAFGVGGAAWLVATIFGPNHKSPVKDAPFECGNPSYGTQGKRFSIKFFIVAILFLVFDLEIVFIYPWSVLMRQLGLYGLLIMLPFITVLVVGLVYEWKKGALEWE